MAKHDRLLDLLLLKKDVAGHLLSEKLDALTVSLEAKLHLRNTLSTVGAYRVAMGEPHFDSVTGGIVAGRPPANVDFTWRGALGLVGKMFLEFLEARCETYVDRREAIAHWPLSVGVGHHQLLLSNC